MAKQRVKWDKQVSGNRLAARAVIFVTGQMARWQFPFSRPQMADKVFDLQVALENTTSSRKQKAPSACPQIRRQARKESFPNNAESQPKIVLLCAYWIDKKDAGPLQAVGSVISFRLIRFQVVTIVGIISSIPQPCLPTARFIFHMAKEQKQ